MITGRCEAPLSIRTQRGFARHGESIDSARVKDSARESTLDSMRPRTMELDCG